MKPPQVEVSWVDSISYSSWRSIDEALEKDLAQCMTTGYLIHKTNDLIAIAGSIEGIDGDDMQVGDVMYIPLVAVREIAELERIDADNNS